MTQERKDIQGVTFKQGDIVAYACGAGSLELNVYEYHSDTPTSIRAIDITPWTWVVEIDGKEYPRPLINYSRRLYPPEELYERMQEMFKPTPLKSCEKRVVILKGVTAQDYPEYYKYKVKYGF